MAEYLDNDAKWSDPIERASGGEDTGRVAKWKTYRAGHSEYHTIGDLCIFFGIGQPGSEQIPDELVPTANGMSIAITDSHNVYASQMKAGTKTINIRETLTIAIWPINPIE